MTGGDTLGPNANARPPRRRTASDQVSEALLTAAEAVLDREGSAGVTVRAVAREADVAPMGVYNRFDNMEGLLAALALRALNELATAIDVPAEASPAPGSATRAVATGISRGRIPPAMR
jgi:AcrR family transcriptional regulator